MTDDTLQLSDELIERTLARRASHGAVTDLLRQITASAASQRQARRWPPRILPPVGEPARRLAWAAIVVMLTVAVALGTFVAGGPPTPEATPASAWTATRSMVTPRSGGQTVTLLADGSVLVAGGDAGSEVVASAELLDPVTLTWTATGEMAQARTGHTATLLPDGRVLVTGGASGVRGNGGHFRSAELYDPATRTWTATSDMIGARGWHTATLLPDGRVLVAGGGGDPSRATAELYDPSTETWTATRDLAQRRANHTATLLPDGRVLIVGGVFGHQDGSCCTPRASAELFDPSTGSWTTMESMVELRGGSTATLLLDGRVLVAGPINIGKTPTGELFDPSTGAWSAIPDAIEPLVNPTATLLPDGRVLIAGGTDDLGPSGFTGSTTAQIYDPATDSWTQTRSMIGSRGEGHESIRLADGRVLLVGGLSSLRDSGSLVSSDPAAEVYDPYAGD